MFAVLYKAHIHPGSEEEYKKLWNQIATHFIDHRGALGSCLHKTSEGEWIMYSRWPDKATRDASWPKNGENPSQTLSPEIQSVILGIKNCIDKNQPFEEICMEIVDDLLFKKEKTLA